MATGKDVKLQLAKHAKYAFGYLSKNPHLALSCLLFIFGATLISTKASMVAGALFGAGASLLGAWITELNSKRSREQDRIKQESDARKYLAPELFRIIERTLHIHDRTVGSVKASSAYKVYAAISSSKDIPPGIKKTVSMDLMEDISPYLPVLYPNVEQFKHLTSSDAVALIAFYDSLYELDAIIKGWWEREARLQLNIYFQIVQKSNASLGLAIDCVRKFELDDYYPEKISLSERIKNSQSLIEVAKHSMELAESALADIFPDTGKSSK